MIGNAGLLLGGKALNAVFNLGVLALTARTLGIEAFGVLALIHAYTQTVGELLRFQSWQVLLTYGTGSFVEKRFGDFHRMLRFSLWLDLASGVAGVVGAIAGVWLIGTGLGWEAEHQWAVSIYALSIFFTVNGTPTGVLRLVDRFDLFALQSPVESWVKLLCVVWAWWLEAGLEVFLAIWFFAKFTSFVYVYAAGIWALKRQGVLKRFRASANQPLVADLPGIWSFVWSTNVNSALNLAFTQVGTLFVGALLGASEAGLYRIAKQLADATAKPAKLLGPALYPELARLAHGNERAALKKLIFQLGIGGGAVATALLLVASLIGGEALRLLIGPEYVAAKTVMLWLLGAGVIGIWAIPLEPLLLSTGSATTALKAKLAVVLPYLPLLYWATAQHGLVGAGVAAVAGALLLFIIQLWLGLRWFGRSARVAA